MGLTWINCFKQTQWACSMRQSIVFEKTEKAIWLWSVHWYSMLCVLFFARLRKPLLHQNFFTLLLVGCVCPVSSADLVRTCQLSRNCLYSHTPVLLALYVPHLQCWNLAAHQSSGWMAVLECKSIYVRTEVVLEFLEHESVIFVTLQRRYYKNQGCNLASFHDCIQCRWKLFLRTALLFNSTPWTWELELLCIGAVQVFLPHKECRATSEVMWWGLVLFMAATIEKIAFHIKDAVE